MDVNTMKKNTTLDKMKYLTHFVTRSFLIAVFCFMGLIGILVTVYFADLFLNASKGNFKNPLFNAYVIVSPSMVPTIKVNDAIVVKREDNNKYVIGDIITFLSSDINYSGLTVTHRVVDKKRVSNSRYLYTTKGDNNTVIDPAQVSTEDIYGRVLFKIPKIGYVQSFLSKPSNFFLCILGPAFIVIIYDLFRIFRTLSKRKVIMDEEII